MQNIVYERKRNGANFILLHPLAFPVSVTGRLTFW